MINVKIMKIINPSNDILRKTTDWMYNWWGIEDNYSYEEVECYMKNSFNVERLPQTFGLFLDDNLIGMYQLTYRDIFSRPDIYPWVANLYVDNEYRNRGYGKMLIQSIGDNARNIINYDEIFLYTKHSNLYERFGWEFVEYINMFNKSLQMEKLYRLKLR